jgi:ribose transport system substrate-binding protein
MFGGLPAVGQEEAESGAPAGSMTIGYAGLASDYWFVDEVARGARQAADESGVTLVVTDAGWVGLTQAAQVEDVVRQGVDAIIVATPWDPDAVLSAIQGAVDAGIPVLTVDRAMEGATAYVGTDNVAGSRLAGEYLFEAMGGAGAVLEIQGDPSWAQGRTDGFAQALSEAPEITLVAQESAYDDSNTARRVTADLLESNPDVTGIFVHTDAMTPGVLQAVADRGLTGAVTVVSLDGAPEVLPAVKDGTLAGTLAQRPDLMGRQAVEAALALVTGEPVDPFIPVETTLVTADNVDDFLAKKVSAAEEAQVETASPAPAAMAPAAFTGGATCGFGYPEEWVTSDPRVTGPCSILVQTWGSPDTVDMPGAIGEYTVNGPEGDWTGGWMLLGIAPTVARNLMVLEGTEAYEGWVVLAWAGTPDDWQEPGPWDLQGVIYEGSAPSLQWSQG